MLCQVLSLTFGRGCGSAKTQNVRVVMTDSWCGGVWWRRRACNTSNNNNGNRTQWSQEWKKRAVCADLIIEQLLIGTLLWVTDTPWVGKRAFSLCGIFRISQCYKDLTRLHSRGGALNPFSEVYQMLKDFWLINIKSSYTSWIYTGWETGQICSA